MVIQTVGFAVFDEPGLAPGVPLEQAVACPGVSVAKGIEIGFRLDVGEKPARRRRVQPHLADEIVVNLYLVGQRACRIDKESGNHSEQYHQRRQSCDRSLAMLSHYKTSAKEDVNTKTL